MALDIIDVLLTCKRKESAAARLTSSLLKQVQIDTREKWKQILKSNGIDHSNPSIISRAMCRPTQATLTDIDGRS